LDIGAVGDATVLELAEGEFEYRDVSGEVRLGRQRLNARGLVVAGRVKFLARISQRGRCIGTLDLRKSFWKNGLSQCQWEPDADRV
jgi:predicted amidohydrolase